MSLQLFLFFSFFIAVLSQDPFGFGKLEIVSDLLPEDCLKQNLSYIEADGETGLPHCDQNFNGEICFQYFEEGKGLVYNPTSCSKDGTFAPKQCKGERATGRCFCFDKNGMRIFGQQWWTQAGTMTCACSRRKADMVSDDPKDKDYLFFNSLHCDSVGNFEPLQCDVISEQCWCADDKTGDLTSPVVPMVAMAKLPCYNSLTLGSQYLRLCENQKYAQKNIEYQLYLRGTNDVSFGDFVCDEDGAYGVYTVIDGSAFCTWRDNSKIGTFQYPDTDRTTLNCNCARDMKYFSEAGKTQQLKCSGGGNYAALQGSGKNFYCVDNDGYKKSPKDAEVKKEENCANFTSYDDYKTV